MIFKQLGVIDPILQALERLDYHQPTPIQEQAIPLLLSGNDLLGCAQTGTGKTAAFSIPILQKLYLSKNNPRGPRAIRALIMAPTRELAIQIGESIGKYGKYTGLRHAVVFGGVKQNAQVNELRGGVDILVATPGRLMDLMGQGIVTLHYLDTVVLDEADHMLDMGFIHSIRKIIAQLPKQRQSLFFSATMPDEIRELANSFLVDPLTISIKPEQPTADRVTQSVYHVAKANKIRLLQHLLEGKSPESTLIFSRTKHGADKIVKQLKREGIEAAAIHGNKSQGARQEVLGKFKGGKLGVLVATDIAARGIDVSELELVVNYDLPDVPETYVHRIGRTGRASASGMAISFCDAEERDNLRGIQRLIKQTIPVVEDHPFLGEPDPAEHTPSEAPMSRQTNPQRGQAPKPRQGQPRQNGQNRPGDGQNGQAANKQEGGNSSSPNPNKKRRFRGFRGKKQATPQ